MLAPNGEQGGAAEGAPGPVEALKRGNASRRRKPPVVTGVVKPLYSDR